MKTPQEQKQYFRQAYLKRKAAETPEQKAERLRILRLKYAAKKVVAHA